MDKTKTQVVKKMTIICAADGVESTGPAFLNGKKAYCLTHYKEMFPKFIYKDNENE